jgi:hypothetical protein
MRWIRSVGLGLLLPLTPVLPAHAIELENAGILAVGPDLVEGTNWSFQTSLLGTSDIISAKLTKGSTEVTLDCGSCDDGRVECDFDQDFASFAALVQAYPAGDYQLSINDSASTALLSFAPSDPPGTVTVTSPMNEEVVGPTPTAQYTSSCPGCNLLLFGLFSFFGDFSLAFTTDDTSPGSIPYAAWQTDQTSCDSGSKPPSLPEDDYITLGIAFVGSTTTESLSPGGATFEYRTGGYRGGLVLFEVPEPSAALLQGTALLGLMGLAARRRG